jgi:phage/plasmid-associated DNA primase
MAAVKKTDTQILADITAEVEAVRGPWFKELLGENQQLVRKHVVKEDKDGNVIFDAAMAEEYIPRTELYAADAIKARYEKYFTYIASEKTWYVWDGMIHRPYNSDMVMLKVVNELFHAVREALSVIKDDYDRRAGFIRLSGISTADAEIAKLYKEYNNTWGKHKAFRDQIANDKSSKAVVNMLKRVMDKGDDHFLDDRQWVVVNNGVFDMEAVRRDHRFDLLPHDATRPVFRMWNIDNTPGATYPSLNKFLTESIEDEGQAKFYCKATALALFGAPQMTKTLVSLQGATNSGKSMITRVVKKLADGSDFYSAPPRDAIVAGARKPEHSRYKMRRARYAAFSEIRVALDSEFVLQYTGGDDYGIEEKFVESSTVAPQGIIFMASNKGTQVDKTDEAMFSRIAPIFFPHTFVAGIDEKPTLERDIISESAGFLEWLKWGYLEYLKEGLDKTDRMEELKRGEREADSTAMQYINEQIENNYLAYDAMLAKSRSIKLAAAHEGYVSWCGRHGIMPRDVLNQADFSKHLQVHYGVGNTGGFRIYGLYHTNVAEQALFKK